MPSVRRLSLILFTVLALVVPLTGVLPAQAVGSGNPVLLSPEQGGSYYEFDILDLTVDFSDAPYGTYDYEVLDADLITADSGSYDFDGLEGETVTITELYLSPGDYSISLNHEAGEGNYASADFSVYGDEEPIAYSCTVNSPSSVSIVKPSTYIYASFGSDCDDVERADWNITHRSSGTYSDYYAIDTGEDVGPWLFYDFERVGTYDVEPDGAYDYEGYDADQNYDSTVVKLGSRQSIASSRSGNYVTLTGTTTRYSPSYEAFRAWAGRPVSISYRTCGTCGWRWLKTVTSNSSGRFSVRTYSSRVRYYRASVAATSTTWGRTSTATRR